MRVVAGLELEAECQIEHLACVRLVDFDVLVVIGVLRIRVPAQIGQR